MSATLTDLLALVDAELENYEMRGSAEATGDGTTTDFLVAPLGCQVVNDSVFAVFVAGSEIATFTMDYTSGVCRIATAPTDGQAIAWVFTYKHWSTALVTQAINAAIDNLFPAMYVRSSTSIVTDGSTYEVAAPAGTEFVVGVDSRASATDAWKGLKRKRFELIYTAGVPSLRFYSAPQSGFIRVHTVSRPTPLAVAADDLAGDAGLPERAKDAIISYACYYLLAQKMAPRVRSDVGVVTQGTGGLMPSQMNYGAQGYMMRFQLQMASLRMQPWQIR
jgi:hypothetical protein